MHSQVAGHEFPPNFDVQQFVPPIKIHAPGLWFCELCFCQGIVFLGSFEGTPKGNQAVCPPGPRKIECPRRGVLRQSTTIPCWGSQSGDLAFGRGLSLEAVGTLGSTRFPPRQLVEMGAISGGFGLGNPMISVSECKLQAKRLIQ